MRPALPLVDAMPWRARVEHASRLMLQAIEELATAKAFAPDRFAGEIAVDIHWLREAKGRLNKLLVTGDP